MKSETVRKLRRFTVPAESVGKSTDLKRLRDEFHDERIDLLFDKKNHIWQLWYNAPSSPYIISTFEPCVFVFAKANSILRERQQTGRELKDEFKTEIQRRQLESQQKTRAVAEEMAGAFASYGKGKITTSMISRGQ